MWQSGGVMAANQNSVRITFTPEQREQVKKMTNQEVEAIELSTEELEERIAPVKQGFWRPVL
jgi:hypothetical protein